MPLRIELGCQLTGDPIKNNCSKFLMATITTESELVSANRHQSSVGDVSGKASCQVWEAGSGQMANQAST